MIRYHQLIDIDNPKCLYCNSNFIHFTSNDDPTRFASYNKTFKCEKCNVIFTIYYNNKSIKGFGFTCFDIEIWHNYWENQFAIKKTKSRGNLLWIDPFLIDFSNKNKLYNKLTTYLNFS